MKRWQRMYRNLNVYLLALQIIFQQNSKLVFSREKIPHSINTTIVMIFVTHNFGTGKYRRIVHLN